MKVLEISNVFSFIEPRGVCNCMGGALEIILRASAAHNIPTYRRTEVLDRTTCQAKFTMSTLCNHLNRYQTNVLQIPGRC